MDIEKKQTKVNKSLLTMYSTETGDLTPLTVEAGTTDLNKFEQGVPQYAQISIINAEYPIHKLSIGWG